ncbi:MAG: HAD hydrolase family protein, partial [Candidatus Levybacteria bacterium]|nr:HAD hydrolase family protein [Candidatus Levybacteria bacterium]
ILGLREFYHVAENGTKVINPQGKLEYNKHIPVREVQQIIDAATELFDSIGFCIDSRWRSEYQNPEKEIVSVLSLSSSSREKAEKIAKALEKLPQKYQVVTGAHWGNSSWAVTYVSHRNTSKGAGLRYIQKKLNISKSQTIAVGDGASDVYMMTYAQEKIAMGNAEPELKKIATYIAPSLSKNGLVEAINKFIYP